MASIQDDDILIDEKTDHTKKIYKTTIEQDEDGWSKIVKKVCKRKPKKELVRLDQTHTISEMNRYFNDLNNRPIAAYLYGSTARNQHTQHSDVDVFVLYSKRYMPSIKQLREMKTDLEKMFLRKVDLVCYPYNNEIIPVQESCCWFLNCVRADAIPIYEREPGSRYLENSTFDEYI